MKSRKIYQFFILLIISALILPEYLLAYPPVDPAPENDPYSGLKSWKKIIYSYVPDSSGYRQELENITQVNYNLLGKITDSTLLDSAGLLVNGTNYLYDRIGQLMEVKYFDLNNTLQWRQSFIFDSEGRYLEKAWFDINKKLIKKINNQYTDAGNIEKITTFNAIDSVRKTLQFRYNSQEQLVEKRWYDQEDILRRKSEYDANGKRTGTLLYHPDGSLQWIYIYSKESNTGQIELQVTISGNTEVRTEFIHNHQKKYTEMRQYDAKGILLYIVVSTYNENMANTEILEYTAEKLLEFRTVLEYDDSRRLLSERSMKSDYSTGELREIPHQLILYEYEDFPKDIWSY